MAKVKSLLRDSEQLFYDRAEAAVNNSYECDDAVCNVVELAEQMQLTDYLGGVDTIINMTIDAYLDNNVL
jgi:hypothetical protein